MRKFLDCLFEGAGYLAGLFMIATLLAVLSSIFGRMNPLFELHGADAYAGYCMASSAFLALASTLRRGEHIRVSLIIDRLSPAAYRLVDIFCHFFKRLFLLYTTSKSRILILLSSSFSYFNNYQHSYYTL